VRKIILDPESEGNIWVKFENVQSAINTQKSLHDRYFSGKKVVVNFVQENLFKKKFGV
jgi:RNA-binding protein 39